VRIPAWAKPYKIPKPRPADRQDLDRFQVTPEGEGLTGFVKGMSASDLEERYARALDQRKLPYVFQYEVQTAYSLPSEERMVDFIVEFGLRWPVEIDAEFTHKSAEQRAEDLIRDGMIDEALQGEGFGKLQRVPEWRVITQEAADVTVREQF